MRSHHLILAATLLCAACSDDHDHDGEDGHGDEVSSDADACEHFEGGPFADGPTLGDSHTAYTITLDADGSATASATIAEGGEWLFFTDEAVPFAIADSGGQMLALEESCSAGTCSADCSVAAGRHVVDIATVGTYDITLGPSDVDSVRLVFLPAEGHEHE